MRFRLVPVPCSDHIGCCWSLPPPKDVTTLLPRLTARAYLQTRSGVVWASLEKTSLALCTRTANVCVRARACVSERERERTSCSIHQNARIVFSHGGAASRACRGGHDSKPQARSSRTASSDQ